MASMGEELRATDYLQMRSEPWYKEHEHKEKSTSQAFCCQRF